MKNDYQNKSIACTVDNCANHCNDGEYCALKQIQIGAHSKEPDKPGKTDCQSFTDCNCQ